MEDLYERIGERLRRAREALGVSQSDFAKMLGYQSAATVSHFESAERKISIADLHRAAKALKVPVDYFLHSDDVADKAEYLRLRAREVHPAVRDAVVEFLLFGQGNAASPAEFMTTLKGLTPGMAASRILDGAGITEPPVSPLGICTFLNVPVFEWSFPALDGGIRRTWIWFTIGAPI